MMWNRVASLPRVLAWGLLLALQPAAEAGLILIGPNPETGPGLGGVQTILVLQSRGQNQPESGCVGPAGFANCGFTDDSVQQGQSQVRSLADVAASIRIVFLPSEPGNDNRITLQDLSLVVYNGNTAIFRSSGLFDAAGGPVDPATGLDLDPNLGYLLRLTAGADNLGDNQAAALQAILDAQPPGSNLTVGLDARLTNAAGGLETFGLRAFTPPADPVDIPEPAPLVLIGASLVWFALRARRRTL